MELLKFLYDLLGAGWAATVPLVMVVALIKIFKVSPEVTAWAVVLILPLNIYLWTIVGDIYVIVDQGLAYLGAFLWIYVEHRLIEKQKDEEARRLAEASEQ